MLLAVVGAPAHAAADEPGTGLLRVAHLSPDTPAVDVALTPAAPPGEVLTDPGPDLVTGLGYGAVSSYGAVPAGAYALSVRAAGAPATTPPVLSTRLELSPGQARTVTLTGAFADLALQPLDDDLGAPPAGAVRVRVLGAAPGTGPLDVLLDGGPPLAEGLRSPGAAAPVTVPGGRYRALVPATGDDAEVDLPAGSVRTVLVLARPGGGVELRVVADADGPAVRPAGGVDAGGGAVTALAGRLLRAVSTAVAAHAVTAPAVTAPAADARPVPAAPARLLVPAAGIDAPLVGAGLDPGGALVPPADAGLVGWYTGGPRPGAPGPAVLTGHVDLAGHPGALARLDRVVPGDEVVVERADGGLARFRVTAVDRHAKEAFPGDAVYAPTPAAELRLITCGGPFDAATGSYRDNVVVSARLVT